MLAPELPPHVEVPSRGKPRERPEVVTEVGLVVVAGATGELEPVDRSGGIDRAPMTSLNRCARWVLLTPAATLRSPIATAPVAAAMTLLVWRTSRRPAVSPTRRISSSSSSISISCGPAAVASRSRNSAMVGRPQTSSTVTGRSRSSTAGSDRNGANPHGLKCTPTDRVAAG